MNRKMLIPALAAVTIGGAAQAQTAVSPSVPTTGTTLTQGTGFNNGLAQGPIQPNFPNTGFGFNNGFGTTVDPRFTDPRVPFFDPRLSANGSALGFTPGVTPGNQFVPGLGGGFWSPGFGYSGPVVDATGAWAQRGMGAGGFGGGLRIAGLNSPPLQPGPRMVRFRDGGGGSGFEAAARVRADQLAQTRNTSEPVVNVGSIDPQQVRLASNLENVMEDRPLTEGTVMSFQDGGVVVRFEQNGEVRTERFATSQVFFFQNGGKLATASTNSRALQPGDQVLIPLPEARDIVRQSVAGSRQETGNGTNGTRTNGARRGTGARRPAR